MYGGVKNVVTAGSQGALDLTRYCGKQVWWIGSTCALTAMSALSPGGNSKAVESAHSLGKQTLHSLHDGQYGKQHYQPCRQVHNRPRTCGVRVLCMCICINKMYDIVV